MNKELSIEQKMEIIQFALEKGARIDIKFHRFTKQNGELLAREFSEMMNTTFKDNSGSTHQWFEIYTGNFDVAIFYKLSNEDKKAMLLKELAALEDGGQINEQSN